MKKLLKIKRLLKARNKSGFTLVEVIISCALLSILVLGIMMFVTPVLRTVTSGQKNARATMLAETVDTYIAGVLRTAKKVEVFENVNVTSSTTGDIDLKAFSPDGKGLKDISAFMAEGENSLNYEVHAIGLVTKDEGEITAQGIRVYDLIVDAGTLNIKSESFHLSNDRQTFNDLMFEGLYVTVKLETFKQQNADGTETGNNARGYCISTKAYNDSKCYSVASQDDRDKSLLAFEGVTYFERLNSAETSDIISVASVQESMDAHGAIDGKLYYPATIIYYVAPKK